MIDFEKNKKLYYSIKEVASHFNVKESLLRYWEKEFAEISPRKTEGGTRQYTKDDIDQITVIHYLVKEKGMTLDGARQKLRTKKDEEIRRQQIISNLENIKKELDELKQSFDDLS
ncbi:MerR family transcriptional regulator [Dysgonomonas sp. 216]|uniref:MerR family transcriptional regulator n=1 Tax=Dysgonomonas sp. 216 TaxID=2302934 RepID=UPI0013D58F15|nr:MerR family transcriptional regulator [Dysgonomonas sp. 216]NDW18522.1 MerR family transcriptional regulator [Dysgonomonas sp. 216]